MKSFNPDSPEAYELLVSAGNADENIAFAAQRELVLAMNDAFRDAILHGDISGDIFTTMEFKPNQATDFPLDPIRPGDEKNLVAFTIPQHGRIPEQHFEGDYINVKTFEVGAAGDTLLKWVRDGRMDILARVKQAIEAMFVRRKNLDAWHTLIAAGVSRNVVAYDDMATSGLFTKRAVAIGETLMARGAGGNTSSLNRGKLTDAYVSIEARQDCLSWDLTQVPEAVRHQIYMNWSDGGIAKIGDVKLHDLVELGVGQEFQKYAVNTLGGILPSDKVEFGVGLDLRSRLAFVNPIREPMTLFEDRTMHRARRVGFYGYMEHGYAVLDSRNIILLAV